MKLKQAKSKAPAERVVKTMQDGNAIARMDARINGMRAMVDALKAVKPATTKLYEALGDD
ncbi:MAG: hypothetical protein K9G33_10970 [Sneathiella sp.]|nr:hypothetical protein [Sneathiella sp.]